MKRLFSILLLVLFAFFIINAQSSELISELKPIPKNFKKFSKRSPKSSYSIIDETNLNFESQIELVSLPNKQTGIAVNVKTTYYDLIFEPRNKTLYAKMRIYGRIISEDKKNNGYFEETLTFEMDTDKYEKTKFDSIIFRRIFSLPRGKYKIAIVAEDFISGNRGIRVMKFYVP